MKNLILRIDKASHNLSKTIFSPLGKVVLGFLSAGLVLLSAAPAGTYSAVQTVDIDMSGPGTISWNINNIVPGSGGVKSVTLRNDGSGAGTVTIWLSNISLTKSAAVATEFGTTPQLDKYLELSVTGSGVTSNLYMPVFLKDFPQSAAASNYVRIDRLEAGASVDLTWKWNLPFATGNDAQGDTVKFDINYTIEEWVPPVVPVPSIPELQSPVATLQIELPGGVNLVEQTTDGKLDSTAAVTAKSTQVNFSLSLAPGTTVTNPDRPEEPPQKITAVITTAKFPSLPGWIEVSPVFDVEGVTYGENHPLVLDKPATINIGYDLNRLPERYEDIAIFYFDEVAGTWIRLDEPPGYVAELGTQAAQVNHFSIFCVLVKLCAGDPTGAARFNVYNMSAGPAQIMVGEETTIKAVVSNVGGETGEYTVALLVNGVATQTQTVTLKPLQCKEVYFSMAPDTAGEYQVQIGDQTFDVEVVNPPLPPEPNVIQKVIKTASPYAWLIFLSLGIVVLVVLIFRPKKA